MSPPFQAKDVASAGRELLRALAEVDPWHVWMITRKDGTDQVVLDASDNPWGITSSMRVPWAASLCSRMADGAPAEAADLDAQPAYAGAAAQEVLGARAYFGLPLLEPDGTVVGSLCGIHQEAREPLPMTRALLRAGATLLSSILSLEQHRSAIQARAEVAEHVAHHDALTGALNRHGLDSLIAERDAAAAADGGTTAVIVLDVDGLKELNDQHGHSAGDDLLRRVAQIIDALTREGEVLARTGGDEFCILLPDCPRAAADRVVDRISTALHDVGIAASFGVAVTAPGAPVAAVLAEADRRMYAVKRSGARRAVLDDRVEPPDGSADPGARIARLLTRAREHLAMDVVVVGRWHDGRRVIEHVAADDEQADRLREVSDPLEETYCQRVVQGLAPRAIPDVRDEPQVKDITAPHPAGTRSHVCVPVHLPSGSLYGTLCGVGFSPDATLNERDAAALDVVASQIGRELHERDRRLARRTAIVADVEGLVARDRVEVALQPIIALQDGSTRGVEALARFADGRFTTAAWFRRAHEVGAGEHLELHVFRRALDMLPRLPHGIFLSINVSATLLATSELQRLLGDLEAGDRRRIVLELGTDVACRRSEHVMPLRRAQALDVRIALDSHGRGFADLQRLVAARPDVVKLDRDLIGGLDRCGADRASVALVRDLARSIGADLIAQGVESETDVMTLRDLDVPLAQGWALGMPGAVDAVRARTLARAASPAVLGAAAS